MVHNLNIKDSKLNLVEVCMFCSAGTPATYVIILFQCILEE